MPNALPAKTPCETGDEELLPWILPIPSGAVLDFSAWMCFANVRIQVKLEQAPLGQATVLIDETGKSEIQARLPALSPGFYILFWSFQTPGEKWQTRVELSVNGTTRFRQRKASAGSNPINKGVVLVEVVS